MPLVVFQLIILLKFSSSVDRYGTTQYFLIESRDGFPDFIGDFRRMSPLWQLTVSKIYQTETQNSPLRLQISTNEKRN